QLKTLPWLVAPLKELGAVGMIVPMVDTYISLQKGTVDGMTGACSTLICYKFADVVKYVTLLNYSLPAMASRFMNWDTWNSLPPDIQKVFGDNIEWWGAESDNELAKVSREGIKYANEQGVEFIELSPEDLDKFYDIIEASALKQAAELDAKGLPGTEIFKEARRLVEKYTK
ncbi:unnamed protein product, partial [marine sediment metagenome]